MTVKSKLLCHLEHIVMPLDEPLNAREITMLCDVATEPQRWQAVLRSRQRNPIVLMEERREASRWALEARKDTDAVSAVPQRGRSSISRDLWWCGNCGRGVGGDSQFSENSDYLAGSWAFCPTCGKGLDWDTALK